MVSKKCIICGIEPSECHVLENKDVMCPDCFTNINHEFADGKGVDNE